MGYMSTRSACGLKVAELMKEESKQRMNYLSLSKKQDYSEIVAYLVEGT